MKICHNAVETNDPRRLNWQGCSNTRHLGGFSVADGRVTDAAALVRSDNLTKLTLEGLSAAMDDGVKTVIDLRFPQEIEKQSGPFENDARGVQCRHRPLMTTDDDDAIAPVRAAETTLEAYRATLEGFGERIADIVATIADAVPGRIVVHCSAGKDRTGLVTALVLRAVGVWSEAIADDYALTDDYLKSVYDAELEQIADVNERARHAEDQRAKPEYILETLRELETRHGSVEGYLRQSGVTHETLERLRHRLLRS